jgi:MFS family permease
MALVGLSVATQLSMTNGFLQTTAPDHLRGRVVALYTWLFAGLSPIGGLTAGWLAEHVGAPRTAIGMGVACCVTAVLLSMASPRGPESPACPLPGPLWPPDVEP